MVSKELAEEVYSVRYYQLSDGSWKNTKVMAHSNCDAKRLAKEQLNGCIIKDVLLGDHE